MTYPHMPGKGGLNMSNQAAEIDEEGVLEDNSKKWKDLAANLKRAKAKTKAAKEAEGCLIEDMKCYMEEHEADVIVGGGGTFYWRTVAGGQVFDKTALMDAEPLDMKKVKRVLKEQVKNKAVLKTILSLLKVCTIDFSKFQKDKASSRPFNPHFDK